MCSDELDVLFSAFSHTDSLPSPVARELTTGILPPVSDSEERYLRVQDERRGKLKGVKVLEMASLTVADTKGYRIRTAYRLVRQSLRVKGILQGWELVAHVLPSEGHWTLPVSCAQGGYTTGLQGVRSLFEEMDTSSDGYTFNTNEGYRRFVGSTALPPPIPDSCFPEDNPTAIWSWRASKNPPPDYHPSQDKNLCLYCEAMTVLSEQLCIAKGAPEEPWSGVYGLAGLLNPFAARMLWPSKDELLMFEEELILKLYDMLSHKSSQATEAYVRQFFGFSRFESVDIVRTTLAVGGQLYGVDPVSELPHVLRQLDVSSDDADFASDVRAKAAIIKLRSQLLGLTRDQESETMQALRTEAINALNSGSKAADLETDE